MGHIFLKFERYFRAGFRALIFRFESYRASVWQNGFGKKRSLFTFILIACQHRTFLLDLRGVRIHGCKQPLTKILSLMKLIDKDSYRYLDKNQRWLKDLVPRPLPFQCGDDRETFNYLMFPLPSQQKVTNNIATT